MSGIIQNRRRQREEIDEVVITKVMNDGSQNANSISLTKLKKLKVIFFQNDTNRLIQNALCSNSLLAVCENREFMQSRDNNFSHVLDPKLTVSNQGLSGRCWLFALLNVMRHELIRSFQLPFDFELSESYLSFYEKIEKCNKVLMDFINKDNVDITDLNIRLKLVDGVNDGGHWITCKNLIQKYGIIPKTCFKESQHSYESEELNEILGYKIKEFVLRLTQTEKSKRYKMKDKMMEDIYSILVKMLGCPPNVDEKVEWSYILREDLIEKLARENKRKENDQFETIQIKKSLQITPHEFYKRLIVHDLNDYYRFSNDPRNPYNKYYQSYDDDYVIGGEQNGYFNVSMDEIIKMCVLSIKKNTPVQFDCDVRKYLHNGEELLDTRCFNYQTVFNMSFNDMTKEERMKIHDSHASHAMVLVGINEEHNCHSTCATKNEGYGVCNCRGRKIVTKFKIENSWGRDHSDIISEDDNGYYTAGMDWFNNYVYNVVIHKDFVDSKMKRMYNKEKTNCTTLPQNDIMD
jgi:bleomycin hydrolase